MRQASSIVRWPRCGEVGGAIEPHLSSPSDFVGDGRTIEWVPGPGRTSMKPITVVGCLLATTALADPLVRIDVGAELRPIDGDEPRLVVDHTVVMALASCDDTSCLVYTLPTAMATDSPALTTPEHVIWYRMFETDLFIWGASPGARPEPKLETPLRWSTGALAGYAYAPRHRQWETDCPFREPVEGRCLRLDVQSRLVVDTPPVPGMSMLPMSCQVDVQVRVIGGAPVSISGDQCPELHDTIWASLSSWRWEIPWGYLLDESIQVPVVVDLQL